MEEKAESAKKLYPDIDPNKIDYLKQKMIDANLYIFNHYETSYEEILLSIIDELTIELEKEIKISFSDEEIKQLLLLVNNPFMQKLLSNTIIFSSLKKFEIKLEQKIREKIYSALIGDILDNKKNIFNIQDHFPEDENKDDWSEEDSL